MCSMLLKIEFVLYAIDCIFLCALCYFLHFYVLYAIDCIFCVFYAIKKGIEHIKKI